MFPEGKEVIGTLREQVVFGPDLVNSMVTPRYPLQPCNHEEFDTRVMLHAANAAEQGHKRILIRANDTDVVVLLLNYSLQRASDSA